MAEKKTKDVIEDVLGEEMQMTMAPIDDAPTRTIEREMT